MFYSEAQYREYEEDMYYESLTPEQRWAEEHSAWHRYTGEQYGCPWDACHPPEPYPEYAVRVVAADVEVQAWDLEEAKAKAKALAAEYGSTASIHRA